MSVGLDAELREQFEKYPQMSGIIVVGSNRLEVLAGWEPILGQKEIERVRALALEHPAFAYGVRRSPKAAIYLFVGRDAAALGQVIDRFVATNEPFEGVRFAEPSDPSE
jgi:hypothetical protein